VRALLALVTAALLLAGCVPASPDVDTYRDKTIQTLGSAVSDTRTVARLMTTMYDGRMLRPTAVAQLRHTESALGTATTAFTELNPPPSQDPLNRRVGALLQEAGDLVADARVALERGATGQYPTIARDLERVAVRMGRLEDELHGRTPS
jgi:hypothetical protein